MERQLRFDVLVNGVIHGEVCDNTSGYRIGIPIHIGRLFDPGEVSEAGLRKAVANVSRWAQEGDY